MRFCYEAKAVIFSAAIAVILANCAAFFLAFVSRGVEIFLNLMFFKYKKVNIYPGASFITLLLCAYVTAVYAAMFIRDLHFCGPLVYSIASLKPEARVIFQAAAILIYTTLSLLFIRIIIGKINRFVIGFKPYAFFLFLAAVLTATAVAFMLKPSDAVDTGQGAPPYMAPDSRNRPNVIFIYFDSLSAKETSLYGYNPKITPNIEKFAEECFVFENMHSAGTDCVTSFNSMIFGIYPSGHNKIYNYYNFEKGFSEKNMFTALSLDGYDVYHTTASGIDLTSLHNPNKNIIRKICLRYDIPLYSWLKLIYMRDLKFLQNLTWNYAHKHDYVSSCLMNFYSAANGARLASSVSGKPFFIFINIDYLHDFFAVPEAYRGKFYKGDGALYDDESLGGLSGFYPKERQKEIDGVRAIYDEALSFLDYKVGELIKVLRDGKVLDNSILIITGDHGQSFKGGFCCHGGPFVSEEVTRIPFIVRFPRQEHGERINTEASNIDIAPTIMDLSGVRPYDYRWMQGESLVPYMKDPGLLTDKPKLCMWFDAFRKRAGVDIVAVWKDGYKLIYYPTDRNRSSELYYLSKDQFGECNIADQNRGLTLRMEKMAADFL